MSVYKNCLICNKEFKTKPCEIKRRGGKFCSRKCYHKSHIGTKHSEETKMKMRKSSKRKLGKDSPSWKGGRRVKAGYVLIYSPNHPFKDERMYVSEHRLVVEKHLNRHLLSKEIVHHIGDTDDNRPSLLIAFSSNSAHGRFHGNPNNVKPEEIIFDGRLL